MSAALVAMPAGVLLVSATSSLTARCAAAVFAVSLFAVYATSGAYHVLARSADRQRLLQRLDHSMIYVLIAGTYTPLCLVALPPQWGVPLLVVVWLAAACGVVLCVLWRARMVASSLYGVMGWMVVFVVPPALGRVPTSVLLLLAAGAVAYGAGAVLFATSRPRLSPKVFGFHEMWHAFTVVAGVAHFAAISTIVASA